MLLIIHYSHSLILFWVKCTARRMGFLCSWQYTRKYWVLLIVMQRYVIDFKLANILNKKFEFAIDCVVIVKL